MRTPRPRPVPPGTSSAKKIGMKVNNADVLRSGASQAMRDQAMRRAASPSGTTIEMHRRGDGAVGGGPFASGDDWVCESNGEFLPR